MSSSSIDEVGGTWERLAQLDPLWAVLSEPDKIGRNWNVDEFLQTGRDEISGLLAELAELGLTQFDSALDFGCGVGRLSMPLSARFRRVTAVDIAPTMIHTATELAGPDSNITFVVNQQPDLAVLSSASFDLVYSNIVLQHMPPELATHYIREFYRVVRPGGFVVFQIPSHLTESWLPNANDGTQLAADLRRAEISVIDAPVAMESGQRVAVALRVGNVSDGSWTQDLTNQLNVGNHWYDVHGSAVSFNDGRERLPGTVAAGESTEISLVITAPADAGSYVVEFDVVQEGVAWFADSGSATARQQVDVHVPAEVQEVSDVVSVPDDREYPTFMMRGIPRADIGALVDELGGVVLDANEHLDKWVSYRYITRRQAG